MTHLSVETEMVVQQIITETMEAHQGAYSPLFVSDLAKRLAAVISPDIEVDITCQHGKDGLNVTVGDWVYP